MLFVRKTTPTVVVRDDSAVRAEAALLAEERGKASATVAALGVLAIVVLLALIAYFAWWAPMNAAQANQPPVEHETIIQQPTQPAPTIVAPTSPPPTVIHEDHIVEVPSRSNTNTTPDVPDDSSTGGDSGAINNPDGATGTTSNGDATTGSGNP